MEEGIREGLLLLVEQVFERHNDSEENEEAVR